MSNSEVVGQLREEFDRVIKQCEGPKKRRGRPPKVRPEGVDASPSLTTAPLVDHIGGSDLEDTPANVRPARPSAPLLAREVMDFLLERYDWKPGDWRVILNTMSYVGRLGSYFSQQTRKR